MTATRRGKYRAKTILVVDDDRILNEMYRERLELEGYQTITAGSAEEGLELIQQSPPDLILLDIMMPGMNGWEMLRKLHRSPKTSKIPVIVDTALMQDTAKEKARRMGAKEFFVKCEVTPSQMIQTIGNYC